MSSGSSISFACGVERSSCHASMLVAAAQAEEDNEEGWEDGGDLEDDESGGEGALPTAPISFFNASRPGPGTSRFPELENLVTQDVMLGGSRISLTAAPGTGFMAGSVSEVQARAPFLARACMLIARA